MIQPVTRGVHHVGLSVSKLEESAGFFTGLLGWQEVKRRDDYPAIFVSDGQIMLTLWAIKEEPSQPFNRRQNIGLHHLALAVANEDALYRLYDDLCRHNLNVEFAPELLGSGPAKHMMVYEPSGIRIEFIWPGN